ncbi:Adenylate and Guanylate cyclase catalytic domain containing protein [Trichomonas vaginalis G3]|uniref:Adenylate and Guanylate cyclase catalytic domain containing protein n=1 Tax=Trichomonas vaginalis (strain ATCC PRA-98 / G3) TaxID=412133 RepID=A2ES71_TRIV3|nr:guanylate cyclase protein [Trichomonas vaginalis G3]EAY04508.1 Adenylate and Guanylate cyclase catalytic domain containing protein [Trichomonas vaginalis G3]KAI5503266.1 guanylate cyclase protein [Trichomonas vaginalis G3]|eukprot:XP_001316731.1 Adenylate and Guanylate cyclase catalytic domain containing protein [Trichomonas vaginalis G3]
MRNNFFILFDYVTTASPPYYFLHVIFSIWRILQFFGPSFCTRYYSFWGKDTTMSTVNDVLSFFFSIVPASFHDVATPYFMLIFSCLFIVFYIFIIICAQVYSKQAKLPKVVPPILTVFFGTAGYILPPIACEMAAETIGRMIYNKHEYVNAMNIIGIILVVFTVSVYVWLVAAIYSVTITFRPDSLQTIVPSVQVSVILVTLTLYTITGVASELSLYPRVVFTLLGAVVYLSTLFATNQYGGFVVIGYKKAIFASSISGIILLCICVIFELVNTHGKEYVILAILALWIIIYFVCNFYLEHETSKSLIILDEIEESPDRFTELIKSKNHFSNVVIAGFRYAHPLCLSWKIYKAGIEHWPKDIKIWLSFSKFIAIYPAETQQLDWVANNIMQNKLKGSLAKHTLQQIQTIIRQREANLIPELKSKLDKIGKQVQATKHKVRYIWDLIIQGNVHELESVVHRAYIAIDNCEAEFQHLIRMFPNSRFVARSYSRFLRDVVADFAEYNKWKQNVMLLQRGVSVIPDQTHEFGLRAFPLLPQVIDYSEDDQMNANILTENTLTQEIEPEDEHLETDTDLRMSVRESINDLSIPAYRTARIVFILLFLICFLLPVVVLAAIIPKNIQSITKPLNFMEKISYIRAQIFQVVGLTHHLIVEEVASMPPLQLYDEPAPVHFGGTADTRKQLKYVTDLLVQRTQDLSEVMSFKPGNENMEKVRGYMYKNDVKFTTYTNDPTQPGTTEQVSVQHGIMQFSVLVTDLLKKDHFENRTLSEREIVTIISNTRVLTEDLSAALKYLTKYIIETDDSLIELTKYIMIFGSAFIFIVYMIAAYFIVKEIAHDKMAIYRAIASLPKYVVSRVADSFKVLKKDESNNSKSINSTTKDDELNKQEENMLKIFSTSSESDSSSTSDSITIIVCVTFLMLTNIASICVLGSFIIKIGKAMTLSSPQIDYMMAAYMFEFSSVVAMNLAACHFSGYGVARYNGEQLLNIAQEWQNNGIINYKAVRYGNSTLNVQAFSIMTSEELAGVPPEHCVFGENPKNSHDVYRCWNPDLLTTYVQTEIKSMIFKYKNEKIPIYANDTRLTQLWHAHIIHLFEMYYNDLFSKIVPKMTVSLNKDKPAIIGGAFAILFVGLIFEAVILGLLSSSENRQKFALRLLLHCPGNIVITNPYLAQLLAGNFKDRRNETSTGDAEFYEVLVKDMPDAILMLDMTGKILSSNNSIERIFGIKNEDIVNHSVIEFGNDFRNGNPFSLIETKKQLTSEDDFEVCQVYKKKDESEVHVNLTFTVLNQNIIVTMRDDTQTVMYNILIQDERTKSDRMLASILPPRLVVRVQAGEKNINFAVQSITVVFMDIVSFTPWCGSLPASTVMAALNRIFKEYDSICAMHTTMTKIKCIGDCYMGAGGIFADVNQPALHAKDVVEFGLECIEGLERVNEEINQKLQIRVGVNTGGPIVAGVLGTDKPTFEILGPAINMAQQMEHHGVPMKVHVSRAVYELIYGGPFDIKERGEVEIKNGPVVTYLIEKKKN